MGKLKPNGSFHDLTSTSTEPREAAVRAAADPKVAAWVKSFKRIIKTMPESVYLHAYESELYVVATDEDGDTRDVADGCVDQKAFIDHAPVRLMSVGEL